MARRALLVPVVALVLTAVSGAHAAPPKQACGWVRDAAGDAYPSRELSAAADPATDILTGEVGTRGEAIRFDVGLAELAKPGPTSSYFVQLDVRLGRTPIRVQAFIADRVHGRVSRAAFDAKRESVPVHVDVVDRRLVATVPFETLAILDVHVGRGTVVATGKVTTGLYLIVESSEQGLGVDSLTYYDEAQAGKGYVVGTPSCSDRWR